MEQFGGSAEESQLPAECDGLRDDGSPSYALNAPVEDKDEERVEQAVDDDGEEGAAHGHARMAGTSQYCIQPIVEMRHHVAKQDDEHVLASIGKGHVACSEEVEDFVQKGEADDREYHAEHYVEANRVAKDVLCFVVLSLSQTDADDSAGSNPDHCSEGGREVHKRTCHSHSADSFVAQALSNEDAVHYIIYGRGHHSDDGRKGVLPKQCPDGLCA